MSQASVSTHRRSGAARAAGQRLIEIYTALARRNDHLFGSLLAQQLPRQWAHYPENDAIDAEAGFQWFYHSHAPEDRVNSSEHGHIHLFARKDLWSGYVHSASEIKFDKFFDKSNGDASTRHLLCIGFDAKGVPANLFTVNSWVTGDRMLSAQVTVELLKQISLCTGNADVDGVVESIVHLYLKEIRVLLQARDAQLSCFQSNDVLADESLEILSRVDIDVDKKLASLG